MASPSERTRNNVRAGIFVTLSIVAAVVTIILLTDAWDKFTRPTHEYVVTFEVSDGVKNLKEGAAVRVGGMQLGRVELVEARFLAGEAFHTIDVTFSLDQRVNLYSDAVILITPALIGADAWIEIHSVGTVGDAPVGPIPGESAPGILGSLLGPENALKAAEIVENINVATADARDVVSTIKTTNWPEWSGKVSQVMEWATTATEKIDGILADGGGMMTEMRAIAADNRPKIDDIVDKVGTASENIEVVTGRFREETVDKVNKLLDTGQEGLVRARDVLESIQRDYETWAPDIGETLASVRVVGQQLKLASIEIRRSPWKLLYKPSRTELDHELLYEATRSFAMATSDLKAASESARRLVDRYGAEIQLDERTQELINEMMLDSLTGYEKAQQRLVDVLLAD